MSHIDSFKHEIVGKFGYLPVYHPLEEICGDFDCTPQELIIGGGSGEHPALVIENPTAAVATFLNNVLQNIEPVERSDEWKTIISPFLINNLSSECDSAEDIDVEDINNENDDIDEEESIIIYYDWFDETHENFRDLCRSNYLPNSFYGDDDEFEHWLICGIGEFIFYAMPQLVPEIMSKLTKPYSHFVHVYYNNIMLIPPNIPVYSNGGNAFFPNKKNND